MKAIAGLKIEIASNDVLVQCVSHYATGNPSLPDRPKVFKFDYCFHALNIFMSLANSRYSPVFIFISFFIYFSIYLCFFSLWVCWSSELPNCLVNYSDLSWIICKRLKIPENIVYHIVERKFLSARRAIISVVEMYALSNLPGDCQFIFGLFQRKFVAFIYSVVKRFISFTK